MSPTYACEFWALEENGVERCYKKKYQVWCRGNRQWCEISKKEGEEANSQSPLLDRRGLNREV